MRITDSDGTIDAGPFRVSITDGGGYTAISVRLLNEQGGESVAVLWVDDFAGVPAIYKHLDGRDDPVIEMIEADKVWAVTERMN